MSHFELDGPKNFRDLHIKTKRFEIKKGLLYRSDKLTTCTANDVKKLSDMGIKQIIDFRSEEEKKKSPFLFNIENYFTYIEIPIEIDDTFSKDISTILRGFRLKKMDEVMEDYYKNLVVKHYDKFSKAIKIILQTKLPTVFNCSHGKDRTGFFATVLYYICRIPESQIMNSYLLSNRYIIKHLNYHDEKEKLCKLFNIENKNITDKQIQPLLFVSNKYINKSIRSAKNIYGSFLEFIEYKMKITKKLQEELHNYLVKIY